MTRDLLVPVGGAWVVFLFGYLFKELRRKDAAVREVLRARADAAARPAVRNRPACAGRVLIHDTASWPVTYRKQVRREFTRLFGRRNWKLLQAPVEPLTKGLVAGRGQAPKTPPPPAPKPPATTPCDHDWEEIREFGRAAPVATFCSRCGADWTESVAYLSALRRRAREFGLPERNESR